MLVCEKLVQGLSIQRKLKQGRYLFHPFKIKTDRGKVGLACFSSHIGVLVPENSKDWLFLEELKLFI